jgi:hypothetical protein
MTSVRVRALAVVAALAALLAGCSDSAPGPKPVEVPPTIAGLGAAALADGPLEPATTTRGAVPEPRDAAEDVSSRRGKACTVSFEGAVSPGCVFGDPEGKVEVALAGNSKTLQWLPALEQLALLNHWKVRTYTKSACDFTSAATQYDERTPYLSCDEFNAGLVSRLTGPDRPDLVVTALDTRKLWAPRATAAERDALLHAGASTLWTRLTKADVPVLVLAATPRMPINVPDCLVRHPERPGLCDVPRDQAYDDVWKPDEGRTVAGEVDGTSYLDLNPWVCPGQTCPAIVGGVTLYRDRHHLTRTYVETLTPRLGRAIEKALQARAG